MPNEVKIAFSMIMKIIFLNSEWSQSSIVHLFRLGGLFPITDQMTIVSVI